jgi:hypothetical protein
MLLLEIFRESAALSGPGRDRGKPVVTMFKRALTLTFPWIFAVLVGCGGGQSAEPEPETPAKSEEAPPSEEPAEPSDEKSEGPDPAKEDSEKAEETKKEPAKPTRSPKDILATEGMLFSFSFNDSEAGASAETECSEKSGDDPKKKATCLAKARDKIDHDGMIFKKETDGSWTWTTVRRAGAKITVLHKVQFEFGDEKGSTITLKIKGKDKGTKPKAYPATVDIETNDDGIVLNDPNLGKMVYVGKLGQVGDAGR